MSATNKSFFAVGPLNRAVHAACFSGARTGEWFLGCSYAEADDALERAPREDASPNHRAPKHSERERADDEADQHQARVIAPSDRIMSRRNGRQDEDLGDVQRQRHGTGDGKRPEKGPRKQSNENSAAA